MGQNSKYNASSLCDILYSFLKNIEWKKGEETLVILLPLFDYITIEMDEDPPSIDNNYVKFKLNKKQFDFIKKYGGEW